MSTVNFLNIRTPKKFVVITLKFELYHRVMSPNDADGMANSVDPDPLGAVWQSDLGLHCLPQPTVKREIFASSNFHRILRYQSAKIKICEIFFFFWKISVEELVAYMVAVCGSYLFACSKTSKMQLSQKNLPLQAIWLAVKWCMSDPIYSVSRW